MTFTQSIVDDSIQKNIEFQSKAGLQPRITRTLVGKGCEWCRNLAGTYQYPDDVPEEVYHRHERCRCIVNYHPGDGRKQDVWSKKWNDPDKDDKIEERKQLNMRLPGYTGPSGLGSIKRGKVNPAALPNGQNTSLLTFWIDEGNNQIRMTNMFRAHEKDRRKYK